MLILSKANKSTCPVDKLNSWHNSKTKQEDNTCTVLTVMAATNTTCTCTLTQIQHTPMLPLAGVQHQLGKDHSGSSSWYEYDFYLQQDVGTLFFLFCQSFNSRASFSTISLKTYFRTFSVRGSSKRLHCSHHSRVASIGWDSFLD